VLAAIQFEQILSFFSPTKIHTHTHTLSLSLSLSLFLPVGLVSSLVAIAVRELFFVTSGNWDM
jgi:hypothetical protein